MRALDVERGALKIVLFLKALCIVSSPSDKRVRCHCALSRGNDAYPSNGGVTAIGKVETWPRLVSACPAREKSGRLICPVTFCLLEDMLDWNFLVWAANKKIAAEFQYHDCRLAQASGESGLQPCSG